MKNPRHWLAPEIDYLVDKYPTTPAKDIAEKLGRTCSSIRGQAIKLDLRKYSRWDDEGDKKLIAMRKNGDRWKTIGRYFERSDSACCARMVLLSKRC